MMPISFAEIDAFARLRRLHLEDWEIDLIRALDETKLGGKEPEPQVTMTPKLFRATFGGE